MTVPIFWQRDPKYKGYVLDDSPYSFWDYGCLLCSLASVFKYCGKNTDPIQLDVDLTKNGGLGEDGLIVWNKTLELYPDLSLEHIICGTDPAPLSKIDEALNNNFPVIVETRFGQDETAMHFVALTKKNGVYTCIDPWFGDECSFNERYGEPSRWIYSVAIYRGTAGNGTVAVPSDVFEKLVSNSSRYDQFVALGYDDPNKIKQKLVENQNEMDALNSQIKTLVDFQKQIAVILRCTDQPNEIIGEITRLMGIEDIKNNLEKENSNLKIDIAELERDTERLKGQLAEEKQAREALVVHLESLQKEKMTTDTSLSNCELRLQNLIEQGVGKLVKTIKFGGYIIQFFKPKK